MLLLIRRKKRRRFAVTFTIDTAKTLPYAKIKCSQAGAENF